VRSGVHLTNSTARGILVALTHYIRLLTLAQAHRTWWSQRTLQAARAKLKMLVADEFLVERRFLVHPELPLLEPVLRWKPGQPTPECGPVSYQLRNRWTDSVVPTVCYLATRKAAKLYGGFSGGSRRDGLLRHPFQATHDVHVSALYLRLLKSEPEAAKRWIPEEKLELQNHGGKLFDAVIVNASGVPERVVEFGGGYRVTRVKILHGECARKALPYELW